MKKRMKRDLISGKGEVGRKGRRSDMNGLVINDRRVCVREIDQSQTNIGFLTDGSKIEISIQIAMVLFT